MVEDNTITEVTRRAIFDFLSIAGIGWSGRLPEDEFLSRLYDLAKLPSHDHRFHTMAGDLFQHRVAWNDWEDDWVFRDDRLDLLRTSDKQFLQFLCETVHPVVRSNADEARTLVDSYNEHLRTDGWELFENGEISGHPAFKARRLGLHNQAFNEPTGWSRVDRQVQEARLLLHAAKHEEQFQAVGLLCRELLISAAQEVYDISLHGIIDDVLPSKTDASRMLEAFFDAELEGSANAEARAHAKAALRLANALQHKRTADFRIAALSLEAALSIVNLCAVITGRRDVQRGL